VALTSALRRRGQRHRSDCAAGCARCRCCAPRRRPKLAPATSAYGESVRAPTCSRLGSRQTVGTASCDRLLVDALASDSTLPGELPWSTAPRWTGQRVLVSVIDQLILLTASNPGTESAGLAGYRSSSTRGEVRPALLTLGGTSECG
jgi:hypothetical protein